MSNKPECPSCGHDDYEGELSECPWCNEQKCEFCDMGDDTSCINCE